MVKHADLLVCDSENIESYIKADYARYAPKTTYIAMGRIQASLSCLLTMTKFSHGTGKTELLRMSIT